MRKVLALLTALVFFGGLAGATTTTTTLVQDVTSSKNEVLAKGTSPHVRLFDTDGTGNYGVSVDHGVFQFTEEQVNGLFSAPSDAKLGIAFTPPANLVATASNTGGHLATGTYYIVVTALDGGTGQTFASNEVSCVITTGSVGSCALTWTTAPPPTASYLVYVGTTTGSENVHFPAASTSFTLKCSAAGACSGDGTGTSGSPPAANTAFLVYLDNLGLHFADGSSQLTASAGGAWMANGAHWISTSATGRYGISTDGHVFTPDGTLTVTGPVATPNAGTIDIDDGATITVSGHDLQLFSNKKASANLLWDTGSTSWLLALGNSNDKFVVYRAVATGGAPSYVEKMSLDSSGGAAFPGRVKGTAMAHGYDATNEKGANFFQSITPGSETSALATVVVTTGGANVVRISASAGGTVVSTPLPNVGDMTVNVYKDGSLIRVATVGGGPASGESQAYPWSIQIEHEETPTAASHTYTVKLKPDSTTANAYYNYVYLAVDEMP